MPRRQFFSLIVLVTVFCASGHAWPEPLSIETDKGPYQMYDQSFALIVGVWDYKNPASWSKLHEVEGEINRVEIALRNNQFETTVLRNPTSAELKSRLHEFLARTVSRDTRLLVYFAGHGWTDDTKTGYVLPSDAPAESDSRFLVTALSMEEVKVWGAQSRAKHIIFVFDSCFSGSVFLTRSGFKPSDLFVRDADQPGRQFISAGSEIDQVPDSEDFSNAFVAGLSGDADYTRDGIVTASELGFYLKSEVTRLGKQTPEYGSDPSFAFRRGDAIFVPTRQAVRASRIKLPVLEAPTGLVAPSATSRSLGDPLAEDARLFSGVDVVYFQKVADGDRVHLALTKASVPFTATRDEQPQQLATNALTCGTNVPATALKKVALSLVDQGVDLKAIRPSGLQANSASRIEILTITEDAEGKTDLSGPRLTRDQIEALTGCPEAPPTTADAGQRPASEAPAEPRLAIDVVTGTRNLVFRVGRRAVEGIDIWDFQDKRPVTEDDVKVGNSSVAVRLGRDNDMAVVAGFRKTGNIVCTSYLYLPLRNGDNIGIDPLNGPNGQDLYSVKYGRYTGIVYFDKTRLRFLWDPATDLDPSHWSLTDPVEPVAAQKGKCVDWSQTPLPVSSSP